MNRKYIKKFNLPEQIEIINYLDSIEFTGYYKNNNIQAIDQKCTFDILNVNAKCILNLIQKKQKNSFKINDFLEDEYTKNIYKEKTSFNGKAILKKNTKKEYDKVIGNILETLSYAEILNKKIINNTRVFSIKDEKIIILEKLANSEMACVAFICHFVWNLVKNDDKIINYLFKMNQDKFDNNLRIKFKISTIEWIKNNSNRIADSSQISQKINNPLFYLFKLKKYSSNIKTRNLDQGLNDLSYFRIHRRDKNKNFGLTRKEWNYKQHELDTNYESFYEKNKKKIFLANLKYFSLINNKEEKQNYSEFGKSLIENGAHVHHIWPRSFWDPNCENLSLTYRHMCENLILLNQIEHLGIAHPNNNTHIIDEDNLPLILLSQYEKIRILSEIDDTYDIRKFYMLCCLIYKIKTNKTEKIDNFPNEMIYRYIEDILI